MNALDTSPAARQHQREAFRRMTPEERVAFAVEMSDEIRSITEAGIRSRHPEYADDEVRAALVAIVVGRADAARMRPSRFCTSR